MPKNGSPCVKILVAAMILGMSATGCFGVSKDYLAASVGTIRTNSKSSLETLEGLSCELKNDAAGNQLEVCSINRRALDAIKNDQQQIYTRAEALCAIAEPACEKKEVN